MFTHDPCPNKVTANRTAATSDGIFTLEILLRLVVLQNTDNIR